MRDEPLVGRWRKIAREFARDVIEPVADSIDREDAMPASIRSEMARSGFMGLTIPPKWGGAGADTRTGAAVLEELSAASAAVATLLSVHLSVAAQPIVEWGTEEQRSRYLPSMSRGEYLGAFGLTEPGAGSDAARIECRYRREDGQYVLNGTKMFITNAASSDLTVVFATRDPALGRRGSSAFLVPRRSPGFSVSSRFDKLGLRGSETVELVLENVSLPEEARLGAEGEGLRIALHALAGGRVGIAACALGVARAAFEELRGSVASSPEEWKRAELARSFTDLSAARALIEVAAALKDAGSSFETEASAAKLFAARTAVQIASRAVDVAGVDSMRAHSRAGRYLRDARVFPIVEGTSEIQELILGRRLLDDRLPSPDP